MKDWNVVISIFQEGFRPALHALRHIGPVEPSPYHNVLLMRVEDPLAALAAVERKIEEDPPLYDAISRLAPAVRSFDFHTAEAFNDQAKKAAMEWLPQLAGRSFHVRLHRRGLRHDLRSPDVERLLDDALLDALTQAGTPGHIAFDDADAVIAIDTVDDRAGIGFWTREDLKQHPLLRPN